MVSLLERVSCESLLSKSAVSMVLNGFSLHARRTPLIWILWSFDSCALAVLPIITKKKLTTFCQPRIACRFWVFYYVCFCLASLVFGFRVWLSYLIGFSSQFSVRIKIGANMAAGWRECSGYLVVLATLYGLIFWLFLTVLKFVLIVASFFCLLFVWFLLFLK